MAIVVPFGPSAFGRRVVPLRLDETISLGRQPTRRRRSLVVGTVGDSGPSRGSVRPFQIMGVAGHVFSHESFYLS